MFFFEGIYIIVLRCLRFQTRSEQMRFRIVAVQLETFIDCDTRRCRIAQAPFGKCEVVEVLTIVRLQRHNAIETGSGQFQQTDPRQGLPEATRGLRCVEFVVSQQLGG